MKENTHHCPYCSTFLVDSHQDKPYNVILKQTKSFVVVPTRGSIVEGWILVVPKRHIFSMAQLSLPERYECLDLMQELSSEIDRLWGISPTMFEHGASYQGDLIGCGINHAHLHMAPLRHKISETIKSSKVANNYSWQQINTSTPPFPTNDNRSYLLYSEPEGSISIAYPEKEISQYFRRIVADQMGIPERYDYKQHEFIDNAERTAQKFLGSYADNSYTTNNITIENNLYGAWT